jgi:hypothetical protein
MGFLQGYARKLGVLEYLGTWDASSNVPFLQSGQGQKNGYYVVSVTGSTSLDGVIGWEVGDWAIFNGTTWEQIDNQQNMSSGFLLIDGGSATEQVFDSNVTIDGGAAQ